MFTSRIAAKKGIKRSIGENNVFKEIFDKRMKIIIKIDEIINSDIPFTRQMKIEMIIKLKNFRRGLALCIIESS